MRTASHRLSACAPSPQRTRRDVRTALVRPPRPSAQSSVALRPIPYSRSRADARARPRQCWSCCNAGRRGWFRTRMVQRRRLPRPAPAPPPTAREQRGQAGFQKRPSRSTACHAGRRSVRLVAPWNQTAVLQLHKETTSFYIFARRSGSPRPTRRRSSRGPTTPLGTLRAWCTRVPAGSTRTAASGLTCVAPPPSPPISDVPVLVTRISEYIGIYRNISEYIGIYRNISEDIGRYRKIVEDSGRMCYSPSPLFCNLNPTPPRPPGAQLQRRAPRHPRGAPPPTQPPSPLLLLPGRDQAAS
jgi:hypothetical protein